MNKKYKDAQGKAIKFYKLRMGRKAAVRAFLIRTRAAVVLDAGIRNYRAIQFSSTHDKAAKKVALTRCAAETLAAVNKVLNTDPFKKENAA